MYPSSEFYLPDDGHMIGRNQEKVIVYINF
jgi:hypothetical protein